MQHSKKIGRIVGGVALVLAIVSSLLSFAPFTPAVAAVVVTVPLALIAVLLGVWHTGVLALYWSAAIVLVFPEVIPVSWEWLTIVVYAVGICLTIWLLLRQDKEGIANAS